MGVMRLSEQLQEAVEPRKPRLVITPTPDDIVEAVKALAKGRAKKASWSDVLDHLAATLQAKHPDKRVVVPPTKFNGALDDASRQVPVKVRKQGRWIYVVEKPAGKKGLVFVKEDAESYSVYLDGKEVGSLLRQEAHGGYVTGSSRQSKTEYSWDWEPDAGVPANVPGYKGGFDNVNEAKRWLKARVK